MRRFGAPSRAVIVAAAIVMPLTLFAVLAIQIGRGDSPAFDADILRFVDRHQSTIASALVDRMLMIGGEPSSLVPAVLIGAAILLLYAARRRGDALFLTAAVGGAMLFAPLLKLGFERPPLAGDSSSRYFPSGHATGSLVVMAALVLVSWRGPRRWAVLAFGLVFVIVYGAALVYSQGHYPSDVIGGWSIGLAWVAALYAFRAARVTPERARRQQLLPAPTPPRDPTP